ncbi:MAG: S8 family serine peptidase [Sandaracinus sp.]|nr:S8 family serine peptidase [Myxococcales bacterium]MCB9603671.1 S8 family serine peptidase [Sandaracinus sp.]MCB9631263.1 S8 family serine peptidase [Sandaracinus sp.]
MKGGMSRAWIALVLAMGCAQDFESVGAALRAGDFGETTSTRTASSSGTSTSTTSSSTSTASGRVVVDVTPADRIALPPRLPNTVPWQTCGKRRLLGQVHEATATCPAAGAPWQLVADRFARSASAPRFCSYELAAGAAFTLSGLPAQGDIDDGVNRQPLQWLEPDCEAVVELANPGEVEAISTYARAHVDATRRLLDRPASLPRLPRRTWFEANLPATTDVWILDSSPSDYTGIEPRVGTGSEHGYAVGLAIRDTVCPQGRGGVCPVRFRHQQVLDLNGSRNGSGFIGDLAEGIYEAATRGAKVIVLAVGFHEQYALFGDDETPGYHAGASVILDALHFAASRGAIVVSAAGNRERGAEADSYYGPNGLFPGELSIAFHGSSLGGSLVQTASAIDWNDDPAPNARVDGEASVVAPGFAQIFEDPFRGGFVVGGTGSSFAAAHLASVITLVRAYLPRASIPQVMQIVSQTGVALDRAPSLGVQNVSGMVRVDACRALAEATRQACVGRSCPAAPVCAPVAAGAGVFEPNVEVEALLEMAQPLEIGALRLESSPCGYVAAAGMQSTHCAEVDHDNGIPRPEQVSSQPGVDPCGSCALVIEDTRTTLVIGLDPLVSGSLRSPTLKVNTSRISLGDEVMSPTYSAVRTIVFQGAIPAKTASLNFTDSTGTQSVTSYLPIYDMR